MNRSSEAIVPRVNARTASVRKAALTAAFVGVIFLTSACGASTAETAGTESVAPSESSTLATNTADATAGASGAGSSTLAGTVIDGIPTKKELGSNSKGEYIQNTIDPSNPAFSYNQAIVDVSAFIYTPEEITEVQAMIIKFVAEETIGSSLNDSVDPKDAEAWWERNKDKFEPKNHDEILTALITQDTTKPVVFPSLFRTGKYDLRYGKDVTHVLSQTITPTKVHAGVLDGKQAMKIHADVTFDLAALVDGQVKKENTVGTIGYTSVKDPTTGKWRISGFDNWFTTTPLK